MPRLIRHLRQISVVIALLFITVHAFGQDRVHDYFDQNCSSCHSIGGGVLAGPDLKNVTKRADRHWLVEFIRDPDAKISAKDKYALQLVQEAQGITMPGFADINNEFGEQVLQYIDQQSSGGALAAAPPAGLGDANRGRTIFVGARPLRNGGTACMACHRAASVASGGGRLGPELTLVHRKLGGDRGMPPWLSNPPTQVMATVYRSRPLTAAEVADLTSFFRETSEASRQLSNAPLHRVQMFGLGGSLVLFVVAGVCWRGRIRSVRRAVLGQRGAR
ncbi:MAG TPA: c-type cytochrome [Terriglobales bacterium]|jgi:mono/diheme cytochrome c family protein|nr:c-type cytochrome [Terriglobales bacterium]